MEDGARKTLGIDCVFFQDYQTGIARVWRSILAEWQKTPPPFDVVLIDRDGTAPRFPFCKTVTIARHDYRNLPEDRAALQSTLDEIGAALFVSTYYSHPLTTPSVLVVYDMIPEKMDWDLSEPMWREKRDAILNARAFCCVSQNTAKDLVDLVPAVKDRPVSVNHCGVSEHFHPAEKEEIERFRSADPLFGKRYFIFVGPLKSYKNGFGVVAAMSRLRNPGEVALFVCGGHGTNPAFKQMAPNLSIFEARLSDKELQVAYSGAEALAFPSYYEGFGLPVIEAMACGCPVIVGNASSLPEVAGSAALKVDPSNIDDIAGALCKIRKSSVRKKLIRMGLHRAKAFTWKDSAARLARFVTENL